MISEDSAPNDGFGTRIAIFGTKAIIRSNTRDPTIEGFGGFTVAYIFDVTTGQQLYKLTPPHNWGSIDILGVPFQGSVAISDTAAVYGVSHFGNSPGRGSVFVYDLRTGAELLEFYADTPISHADRFGIVGITDSTLIVGTPGRGTSGTGSGGAYLYEYSIPPCPTDLNRDNVTQTADLSILLGAFELNDPVGDINGDGVVDTADLGALISAFGTACP